MARDKKDKKGGAQQEEQRAPEVARHSAKETPRLKDRFRKEVAPVLMKEFELKLFSMKPSIYSTFANNVRRIRTQLNEFITDQTKSDRAVYVYGASTRGNTILQYCKLDHHLIKKATDANPEKWGRRTPGSEIPIVSKDEARKDMPDFFLVLPHHFLTEIMREEKEYLESGGKFIVPLPEFRIAESSDGQYLAKPISNNH